MADMCENSNNYATYVMHDLLDPKCKTTHFWGSTTEYIRCDIRNLMYTLNFFTRSHVIDRL